MKTKLVSVMLLAMLIAVMLPIPTFASTSNMRYGTSLRTTFSVSPSRVESLGSSEMTKGTTPGTVPFNVDMVDAEQVCETGKGVYVAVLDTGLLSNYLDFFPEGKVDIKEEWGKGFTHNVWYDPTGEGNW